MPNPNPIGISIQASTGFFAKAIRARPRVVLQMDPYANLDSARDVRRYSPESFQIIRYTKGDQNYLNPAIVWCAEAYNFFAPFANEGLLDAVALLNEPHAQGSGQARIDSLKRLNDWHVEAAAFFHARNIKVGAYSASVGEFGLASIPGASGDEWQYLHGGCEACDYLFVHEYTWPMPPTGVPYWLLRYQKMFAELPVAARKPIVITECLHDHGLIGDLGGVFRDDGRGIDGGIIDLRWYADHLAADNGQNGRPRVIGATVFGFGTRAPWSPTFDWGDGDERANALINFISGYVPTPPPVDPIPIPPDPTPVPPDPTPIPPDPTPIPTGVVTMVPFLVPQELLDQGYQATAGTPLKDRPFFRLMSRKRPDGGISGASVKSGVSAFERISVLDLYGRPATGMKIVCLYPDNNGEVLTVGADARQFNNGTGASFEPPAKPPLEIFVASYDAFKDDNKPPRVHFAERWSDSVFAGDTHGDHKENEWVLFQVPTNAAPETFEQAVRYSAYAATWLSRAVYNPDAALQAAARARDLKAVMSDEFYIVWQAVEYILQDYAGGILYTIKGKYGPTDFKVLPW